MTAIQQLGTQHFFTVDVEEHFQVSAFEGIVSREDWGKMPSRVVQNTERILELLSRYSAKGTFFILGWVAEKYPGLVRQIVAAGHEPASHGYSHRRVTRLTPEEFRHDVRLAKEIIENASGQRVLGYRAPSFSICPGLEWAFDILIEEGYVYDSTLFPIRRSGYGYPSAPPIPHVVQRAAGHLCEFPLATTTLGGLRIPAAGGGYLRQLPFTITQRAFREHSRARMPGVFYIHPWELDVDQPRIRASTLTTLRHYRGIKHVHGKLEQLLSEFSFTSIHARLPDIARHGDDAGLLRALK